MINFLVCPRCGFSHNEQDDCIKVLKTKIVHLEDELDKARHQSQSQSRAAVQQQISSKVRPRPAK